jgi:hypothetical protein
MGKTIVIELKTPLKRGMSIQIEGDQLWGTPKVTIYGDGWQLTGTSDSLKQ